MSGHTPGPWELHWSDNAKLNYIDAGLSQMQIQATSEYLQTNGAELAANGRLIAAAPELLEIVQALARAVDEELIVNSSDEDSCGVLLDFARSALTKVGSAS